MTNDILTPVARQVCEKRYFQKDKNGKIIEDWNDLVSRVVNHVCHAEDDKYRQRVSDLLYNTEFLPNSPCLVNAGRDTKSPGLLACFVTKSPEDSWMGMIENIGNYGHVCRVGGGCGVDFSKIRPEGDPVFGSTHAKACGPIEHMRMVSEVMHSITQSGFRSMACMGCLRVNHPDILKFIKCKQHDNAFKSLLKGDIFNHYEQLKDSLDDQVNILLDKFISNFNISVFATDDFMQKVENDEDYDLVFDGKIYQTIKAKSIFDMIVENAWKNGDPGMLFYDTINDSPYKSSEQNITATNPCVTGNTIVLTSEGPKAIKDMCGIQHKVLCLNTQQIVTGSPIFDESDQFLWRNTTAQGAFLTKKSAKILIVETENSKIRCTPDHKILTQYGYVKGQDLKKGQFIRCNPCGIGTSYGLDYTSREERKSFGAEIQSMAENSSQTTATIESMVSGGLWSEENSSDDFDFWVDLLSVEKIFSKRKNVATRKKYCYAQDERDEISKCSGIEELFLPLDSESRFDTEDQKVQLRLVSVEYCRKSVSAEFLRMDNGDVLRFREDFVEDGSKGLCTTEWRNLQARLLHILEEWETEKNNRSEERIHFSTSWLQGRDVQAGLQHSSRIGQRYFRLCPETVQVYCNNTESLEKVVRITEQEELEDVYDLTIDDNKIHNFIANGLVVHNCGEQTLPENGSCNLGSIDVSKFYNDSRGYVEWTRLAEAIEDAIQFLDNVLSINKFPTKDFEKWAQKNRPVGLGIMGWADLLLKMEIAYGSEESFKFAQRMGRFFQKTAHEKSVELGKERGTPGACKYDELEHRRNVTTLSIAPTGTISLIAGCSSAIEPIFSAVTYRYDNTGQYEIPHPQKNKKFFRCASDLNWEEHVGMQSSFQPYIDSAISKTINFPNSATIKDVADAYMFAWKNKCKGITVYRDGCKSTQVLNTSKKDVVGVNHAKPRPKEVEADIFHTRADGIDWHVIVGKVDGVPHEVFAVNGKQELPECGKVIKRKKRHYSLLSNNDDVIIENLAAEEDNIDPKIGLETRRFSLELRHQIDPKYIVEQIDKSNDVITSFSKAVGRIMKTKYISANAMVGLVDVPCLDCAKKGEDVQMISESGCWRCPKCFSSKCG